MKALPTLSPVGIARFHSYIRISTSESGCHVWTHHRNNEGYGIFTFNGVPFLAHRLALHLIGVDVTDKMVLHKCRGRCVNPEHLYIGTAKDNSMDQTYDRAMAFLNPWRDFGEFPVKERECKPRKPTTLKPDVTKHKRKYEKVPLQFIPIERTTPIIRNRPAVS